ncbi:MAG: transglycosylase SLT domain-containing protein [Bradymonadia bacterium]
MTQLHATDLRRREELARQAAEQTTEQADQRQQGTDDNPEVGMAWVGYLKDMLGLSTDEQNAAQSAQTNFVEARREAEVPQSRESAKVDTPKPPSVADEVAAVISLNTEFKDMQVKAVESSLTKAMTRRQRQIQSAFDAVNQPEFAGQAWAAEKAKALKADLERPLDGIITTADCRHVDAGLRNDVIKHHRQLTRARDEALHARHSFARYNMFFADERVVEVLRGTGISAAELKALVAQESGDFTLTDTRGDIAGPAQIGASEAREVGANPKDRLQADTAILLAARVLRQKVEQLKAELKHGLPSGDDYKKFVFASYNAGARTVRRAQEAAVERGLDPLSWDDLVKGGPRDSALTDGIKEALPGLKATSKHVEVASYVDRIFHRMEGVKEQS